MKLVIACLTLLVACASFATCSPIDLRGNVTGELKELLNDLKEFAKLVPVNQTRLLYIKYALKDHEFRDTMLFLSSKEHRALAHNVTQTEAHQELSKYLLPSGLNASQLLTEFPSFLGVDSKELPELKAEFKDKKEKKEKEKKEKKEKGFRGFLKEAKALLPLAKIGALRDQKNLAKGQYAALVAKLHSETLLKLVAKLLADRTVLEYLQLTEDNGADVLAYSDYVNTVFGLNSKK